MKKKASEIYSNKMTYKVNCAQSVAIAANHKIPQEDGYIESLSAFGGGRAHDNMCGALYAAKEIAKKVNPEKADLIIAEFVKEVGSYKCKEIRSERKISCLKCVEIAAGALEQI